jgi:hypothetical protein
VNLIKKLIGAHVDALPPIHPLASVVESELKTGIMRSRIESYLSSLPERPNVDLLHVLRVTENSAVCQCKARVKDHENPRFFDAEVVFEVCLATGACKVTTP